MRPRHPLAALLPVLALAALLTSSPAAAVLCTLDNVPAATLLLPYFAVDLDDPDARTTLFTVANASAAAELAHVVLWTDLGIPTVGFDVYLTGYDVQSVNLRDVFVSGHLPQTAPAPQDPGDTISPRGPDSQDGAFDGCQRMPPADLQGSFLAHLRAAHTGQPSPLLGGLCTGADHQDHVARGYVTVDTVRYCSGATPEEPGYFGPNGLATSDNVLWGDYFYVDSGRAYASGGPLVRIEADPAAFKKGDATFYELFVGGSGADGREPLPTTWSSRFLSGGPFDAGSEVIVWREPPAAAQPFACGLLAKQGFPLGPASGTVFDEQETVEAPGPFCPYDQLCGAAALAPGSYVANRTPMQASTYPVTFPFGWYVASFNSATASNAFGRQAWLGTTLNAHRLISVGIAGTPLDSGCGPAAQLPQAVPQ
jgi:hypothetical protein